MMRKRKGHPVYPLTAAQKFHFSIRISAEERSSEYWYQSDH